MLSIFLLIMKVLNAAILFYIFCMEAAMIKPAGYSLREVQHTADKAIADVQATPMIIVMPDASATKRGFFQQCNQHLALLKISFSRNSFHYRKNVQDKPDKHYRAVAGLSNGGEATLFMHYITRNYFLLRVR